MKIDAIQKYHVQVLAQIVGHQKFDSIKVFKPFQGFLRRAYLVNQNTGLYIKYAKKPNNNLNQEYVFTFRRDNMRGLEEMTANAKCLYIALACVEDKDICGISYEQLLDLVERRKKIRKAEVQHGLFVTVNKEGSFQVYVYTPGTYGKILGDPMIAYHEDFPKMLFKKENS